jgi:hypothetical protein
MGRESSRRGSGMSDETITPSSGCVFKDLGLETPFNVLLDRWEKIPPVEIEEAWDNTKRLIHEYRKLSCEYLGADTEAYVRWEEVKTLARYIRTTWSGKAIPAEVAEIVERHGDVS